MSDLPPGFVVQAPQRYSTLPDGFIVTNAPPPGVIIHDSNRSYVTGAPDAPSVDTTGMDQGQRNLAAAGLNMRQNAAGVPQSIQPFVQGATLGYGDELGSVGAGLGQAIRGGSFGQGYNISQEAQRQALAQERAANPVRSAVSQIGGGLALTPLLAPMAGAGAALPLAGRVASGAATGGTLGGVAGFGEGSGLEDRLNHAKFGAVVGGAIGGAVPAIVQGGKSVINKILDATSVDRNLTQLGVDRPAGDAVMRALTADDAFSGAGARNIAAAGPEGMLVDAGPSTRGALDTAMQRGGPAALIGRQAADARGVGANRTLQTALDRTLGKPDGVELMTKDIRLSTQADRQAAYNEAYNTAIDYSKSQASDLLYLMKRVPQSAISQANALMSAEGLQSKQIMAKIADNGTVTFTRMPDVQQLDYITRGLLDVAREQNGKGALGGQTNLGRIYNNLAGNIRGKVSDLVPEYGIAVDTAADPISRINALRFGASVLSPRTAPDEVAMQLQGMTQPELRAVRLGVRSHIEKLMSNVRGAASDPNQDAREALGALKQLTSRAARDKLSIVLDPDQSDLLMGGIDRAAKAAELYAGTTRNSATFGRFAVDEAGKQMREPGFVGSLMEGAPLQASKRATQFAFGRTPQDKLAATDQMHRQVAELLTGRQGQDALDAMQRLTDAYTMGPRNASLAKLLGEKLGAASGLGAYQGAGLQFGRE